MVETSIEFIT